MSQHIAAGVKHPDNMSRKEKLQMIASLPAKDAWNFWLTHGAGKISKKAFMDALR